MEKPTINRVLITYIATGKYVRYLSRFLETVPWMFPDTDKRVIVLTDNKAGHLLAVKGFEEFKCHIKVIEHYPWPIVTLFKFRHILSAIEHSRRLGFNPDFVVNLDATVIANRAIEESEFLFEGKIGAVNHFLWGELLAKGRDELIDTFWVDYDGSLGWRDSRKIQWQCFPGFLSAPTDLAISMCKEIGEMVEKDLKKNVMPYYHDESYYNKYLDNHPDLVQLIDDAVIEDDEESTHWNKTAMWRVLGYEELQKEKEV